jgi:hypothetical protein
MQFTNNFSTGKSAIKKIIFLLETFLIGFAVLAQNVGIGTNTPQATLDVRGNHRLGGLAKFISYDSVTGKIGWTNSNLFVPVSQYLMQHSASAEGLYYNNSAPVNGQLEYRDPVGDPVFYTNFVNSNGYFKGNLGVGVINPGAKLHVRYAPSGYTGPYQSGAVIEGDWDTYLQFLTPDWSESGLLFGKASNGVSGAIVYNPIDHPNGLHFRTGGNLTRMVITQEGNVGIGLGPNPPLAELHVSDGSVLFSAPGDLPGIINDPPVSGLGRRMMWYTDKAAFRVGYVAATNWDKDKIGIYSVAMGYDTRALNVASTAMGFETTATGHHSTAMGQNTYATGTGSTAMGIFTNATGNYSTAMGGNTVARGILSTVVGVYNDSIATTSPTTLTSTTPLFIVGNGDNSSNRSNALTILKNGNTGIGTTSPKSLLHIRQGTAGVAGTLPYGPLSVETNSAAYIGLLTPDSFESGLIFGKNSNNASGGIIYNNISNTNGLIFRTNGNLDRVAITNTGNMGIGTNSPTAKLDVIGNVCATGGFAVCSDIRYKKDLTPISLALQSILSLNGFYYYWKKNEFRQLEFSDQKQIGFSAQEVEKLFPEIVMTDANGYKSVDYGRITPVLVEAIKEQQGQINKQELQINTQQKQIDELKKLVEKLISK